MEPRLLSADEQDAVVGLLLRGASGLSASKRSGLDYDDFEFTRHHDPVFRRRCRSAHRALAENVASALYKNAMDGSVTAQSSWLRLVRDADDERSGDSGSFIDGLSFHQVVDYARNRSLPVRPEIAALSRHPSVPMEPGGVPQGAESYE